MSKKEKEETLYSLGKTVPLTPTRDHIDAMFYQHSRDCKKGDKCCFSPDNGSTQNFIAKLKRHITQQKIEELLHLLGYSFEEAEEFDKSKDIDCAYGLAVVAHIKDRISELKEKREYLTVTDQRE